MSPKPINHRLPVLGPSYRPPRTYGECCTGTSTTGSLEDRTAGRRQCGALECRHNLLTVRSAEMPGRKHRGLSPEWSVSGDATASSPSCALDVANSGAKSSAEVARILGISTRRVEQIIKEALGKDGAVELWKLRAGNGE